MGGEQGVASPKASRRPSVLASTETLCQHLLDGQGGLVLSAPGALVQQGAETQPVQGRAELLPVEAAAVQSQGFVQMLHGRLQPVLVLVELGQLHVHLAAQQDQETGGRAQR